MSGLDLHRRPITWLVVGVTVFITLRRHTDWSAWKRAGASAAVAGLFYWLANHSGLKL